MNKTKFLFALMAIPLMIFSFAAKSPADASTGIIHDAEFQLLQKQYGERWSAEDKEVEKNLEALHKKHGKRPKIPASIVCSGNGNYRPDQAWGF